MSALKQVGPREKDPIRMHLALVSKVSIEFSHTNKACLKRVSSGIRGRDEGWLLHKMSS